MLQVAMNDRPTGLEALGFARGRSVGRFQTYTAVSGVVRVRYPRLCVPVRALFFDFDGVLWDSEVAALQSWQETYAEHGHRMSLDVFATRLGTL